jgi:hypothetical protein
MASAEGSKNWISGAIKHPGSFTKEAKSAGKSVKDFAHQKEHSKGVVGKRARLAIILSNMRKGK